MQQTQSGRTMIEMLAVLMLLGVIAVAAYTGYKQAALKFNVYRMEREILQIADDMYWAYGRIGNGAYPSKTLSEYAFDGVRIPVRTPFGERYVKNITILIDGNGRLLFQFNLPTEACEQLGELSQSWEGLYRARCEGYSHTSFNATFN